LKKQGVLIAAAIAFGLIAAVAGNLLYRQQQLDRAPQFTLPDFDGKAQSLEPWDGQVIVLNFWGSWCPPCVREIPLLIDLQRERGEQGVQVVGIAVDRLEDARSFSQKLGINYPNLHGTADALAISKAFGNAAGTLPFTVIIDRNGKIRQRIATELEPEELEAAIKPLLDS